MAFIPPSDSIVFSFPHRVPQSLPIPSCAPAPYPSYTFSCLAASLSGPFHVNYITVLTIAKCSHLATGSVSLSCLFEAGMHAGLGLHHLSPPFVLRLGHPYFIILIFLRCVLHFLPDCFIWILDTSNTMLYPSSSPFPNLKIFWNLKTILNCLMLFYLNLHFPK